MSERFSQRAHAEAAIAWPPARAFAFLDDHRRLAAHMDRGSPAMAGASMKLELDAARGQALGSHIRLAGRVLGLRLELDEVVTAYEPPHAKTWATVGEPRLLVVGAYRMGFRIEPHGAGSQVTVWIEHQRPSRGIGLWLLGPLLGGFYARWCVAQMLRPIVEAAAASPNEAAHA